MKNAEEKEFELKTTTGECRFCGQIISLEVPESFTQEEINEEATKLCKCPEAERYTRVQENIANTEGMIRNFFEHKKGLEILKDMLMSAVKPLAEGQITKITISRGEYTGTMKPSKEGIKFSLKYSTEDSIES